MFFLLRSRLWPLVLIAVIAVAHAFALPQNGSLLRLVPAGAEIVAGIENSRNGDPHSWLLLVTNNNNLDWADCQALTGVDSHRVVRELIHVAATSSRGELSEHLLLVAGSFDRNQIFRTAMLGGATTNNYNGTVVLVIKPFAREQREMLDTRWMAIPDDGTVIFGAPEMVKKALDRYASHESPDKVLLDRLAQLHADVTSWNVMVVSPPMLTRHTARGQTETLWTHLFDHADVLTMGIHYGSATRMDLAIHAVNKAGASLIANSLFTPQFVPSGLSEKYKLRVQNVSTLQNLVQVSIIVPGRKFDTWLESISQQQLIASAGR